MHVGLYSLPLYPLTHILLSSGLCIYLLSKKLYQIFSWELKFKSAETLLNILKYIKLLNIFKHIKAKYFYNVQLSFPNHLQCRNFTSNGQNLLLSSRTEIRTLNTCILPTHLKKKKVGLYLLSWYLWGWCCKTSCRKRSIKLLVPIWFLQ